MKNLFIVLLVAFSTQAVFAQKNAVVDIEAVLANSKQGKVVLENVKVYQDSVANVVETSEKTLQTLFGEYKEKLTTYTEEERAAKEQEINIASNRVNGIKDNFGAILGERRDKLLVDVYPILNECVQTAGDASGVDAIVEKKQLLYNKAWIDLSQQVLNCMDAK